MIIDWSVAGVYNTIMSVASGVALLLIYRFFEKMRKKEISRLDGWAIGFAILGIILTLTGTHMTLEPVLAKLGFPFDDIIFGEPVLAFGVMLLGVAFLLWKKDKEYGLSQLQTNEEKVNVLFTKFNNDVEELIKPISYFGAAMGLALISIAFAGVTFQLFAAPAEEPISGLLHNYPWIEAWCVSLLYGFTGLGAILFPFSLRKNRSNFLALTTKTIILVAGIVFVLFGTLNYFTHIGLIVNTMG